MVLLGIGAEPLGFCAALVGPIANLNSSPVAESSDKASLGIAIAKAPVATNRRTRRRMTFMM
jgi:hypothetical protein